MKKKIQIFFLVFCWLSPALAQNHLAAKIGGDWGGRSDGKSIDLRMIVLDVSEGVVAADLSLVLGDSCTGGIEGLGKLNGNVLTLTPYKREATGDECSIAITFDKSGKHASILEGECGLYHGAECEFTGQIEHKLLQK